jgi:cell division protein FtsB
MIDDKHTPGPWQVSGMRHNGDLKIGIRTRLHFVGPDNDAVAAVFFDMDTGKGLADAHLIAKAPTLHSENAKLRTRIAELEKIVSFEGEHNAELRDALEAQAKRIAELEDEGGYPMGFAEGYEVGVHEGTPKLRARIEELKAENKKLRTELDWAKYCYDDLRAALEKKND